MNDKRDAIVSQLQKRLEFVFILALFFPVLLTSLFNISNAGSGDSQILNWGAVICLLIIIFVVIEFFQKHISILALKITNALLISQIICFIPHTYILAQYQGDTIYSSAKWVAPASTFFIYLIPFFIFIVLAIDLLPKFFKGLITKIWKLRL